MIARWVRGRILFIADMDILVGRLEPMVQACLEGGVMMVQLRGKNPTDAEFYERGLGLRELTAAAGALLFINDRLDVALAVGADGVHLGWQDLPVEAARRLLPGGIVGKTCRNSDEAEQAQGEGADYVSLGAIFTSPTKPSAPVVGLKALRLARTRVSVPICAIGGINLGNVTEVLRSGADFVAVVSALSGAETPRQAATLLARLCEGLSPQG